MRWCTLSSCLLRKIVIFFGCILLFLGSMSVYLCFRIECLLVTSSWVDEASLHVYSVWARLVLLYIFFFFFSFHRLPEILSGFRNKKIRRFLDFLVLRIHNSLVQMISLCYFQRIVECNLFLFLPLYRVPTPFRIHSSRRTREGIRNPYSVSWIFQISIWNGANRSCVLLIVKSKWNMVLSYCPVFSVSFLILTGKSTQDTDTRTHTRARVHARTHAFTHVCIHPHTQHAHRFHSACAAGILRLATFARQMAPGNMKLPVEQVDALIAGVCIYTYINPSKIAGVCTYLNT